MPAYFFFGRQRKEYLANFVGGAIFTSQKRKRRESARCILWERGCDMSEFTSVKRCTCKHDFQDKRYGKSLRLHNRGPNGQRCTVCGNVIQSK